MAIPRPELLLCPKEHIISQIGLLLFSNESPFGLIIASTHGLACLGLAWSYFVVLLVVMNYSRYSLFRHF
jgi:hypothetical protein